MKSITINYRALLITLIILAGLLYTGMRRLAIDTDIVESLPKNDPVIADAYTLMKHHPIQDQIAIDIGLDREDPDRLVDIARGVEKRLSESGLFRKIGMEDVQAAIPDLMFGVVGRLPGLFTEQELREKIEPLLDSGAVDRTLQAQSMKLLGMEGIGQAGLIAEDPLGFKDIVLGRMKALIPSGNSKIYKEHLISSDGRHLLLTAVPNGSGTDTQLARKLTELMRSLRADFDKDSGKTGLKVTLTPVGAYRAALDNETLVRNDANRSFILTIIGIVLLMVCAFSRPLIGFLAFIPAFAGAIAAYFTFSLFHRSISILVIGFGGALISAAVDIGITYLLFLDRPHETSGREASHEIWNIGLIATLTTVFAFLVLTVSGFPILLQLGEFSALGILFAYLFVHTVFPKIILHVSPARKDRTILSRLVDRLPLPGRKGLWTALTLTVFMLFFAKPDFKIDFSRMNVVSGDTLAAEKLILDVWGNVFENVYLMSEGPSVESLQDTGDGLSEKIDGDIARGSLSSAFVPAMIFPGKTRREENVRAWKNFWTDGRVAALEAALASAGKAYGFAPDAFAPFMALVKHPEVSAGSGEIPPSFYELLGIAKSPDGQRFTQLTTMTVGPNHDSGRFLKEYGSYGRIFDPKLFSNRFSGILSSTFERIMAIVSVGLLVIVFLFFLDLRLAVITLMPVAFAFICTLGTLNLVGHPLDVGCVMLTIMGMGIDYSLFLVMGFQKYHNESHPSFRVITGAVIMAALTTLVGFGMLFTADHLILKSAGLTCTFGIGYSLLGAFLIIPPLLRDRYRFSEEDVRGKDISARVRYRYRRMAAYHRMFARFKMKADPMFGQLSELLAGCGDVRTIVDIGTGYGVPACWCLEYFKDAYVYGMEPGPDRVNVASLAVLERGSITCGAAPDVPDVKEPADLVLMLDMLHYLSDADMAKAFEAVRRILADHGRLILRTAIRGEFTFLYWVEEIKLRIKGHSTRYKTVDQVTSALTALGFRIEKVEPSSESGDMVWIVAAV